MLDLDDTLFLERDYVQSGFASVAKWAARKLQIEDFQARALAHFGAGRRGNIFDAVLADCARTAGEGAVRRMVEIYRKHRPEIKLLPDAEAFLSFWRGKCALALISDGPLPSQRRKLSALGVGECFEIVVLTGVWARRYAKPNQRAFRVVQDHFVNRGLTYFYIADNPAKDFEAPLALGWETVRVRRIGGLHSSCEPRKECQPRFEVPDLTSLTSILTDYLKH